MDSYEFNKIAGAVLGTVLLVMGVNTLATELFRVHLPETPGFPVEVAEVDVGHGGGEAAAPADEIPLAALMAEADAGKGETVAKKCAACHTFDNGGANKVGPNLWNIVNRPRASHEGFNYSDAMKAAAESGVAWSFEELFKFLEDPKGDIKGTTMGFAGIKKPGDRADLLAYLRSLSDNPAALPAVEAAAPAEAAPAAPAEAAPAAPVEAAPAAPAEAAPAMPAPEGSTTQPATQN
jgi:cytochrome c